MGGVLTRKPHKYAMTTISTMTNTVATTTVLPISQPPRTMFATVHMTTTVPPSLYQLHNHHHGHQGNRPYHPTTTAATTTLLCWAWWHTGRVDIFWSPLFPPRRNLGQVLYLQLPVALRRVNSESVNFCGRERFWKAHAVRSAIEMDKYNTIQYNIQWVPSSYPVLLFKLSSAEILSELSDWRLAYCLCRDFRFIAPTLSDGSWRLRLVLPRPRSILSRHKGRLFWSDILK